MGTEVAVKAEPLCLVEREEVLSRMKTESIPVPITFPCVERDLQDINHVDVKNEAVLSADVCDEGKRMLKSDIGIEGTCLLEDSSEFHYSTDEMDSEVTVKPDSMWQGEDEEISKTQIKDERTVSAADCEEINEELKTEIDVKDNCILGDNSEFIHCCKGARDANVLENEGIIISSTDKFQAVEEYMLEYEEQVAVNIDKNQEMKNSTKKYSQKVHKSFSKCALTSETRFKCDIHRKYFKTNSSIVQHINSHISGKPFKCEVCNNGFTRSGSIKMHMRLHTGEKPFKCKECSKCFTESGNLVKHVRTHTGEQPFKCKECSKCFTQSSSLSKHMRTHTGEQPYKCNECSVCFIESGSLKRHMRLHTGEKPFKCKECSESFTQSGNLKQHMRTHTGEKPFKCKECSKCFARSGHLNRHVRTHSFIKPFKCI